MGKTIIFMALILISFKSYAEKVEEVRFSTGQKWVWGLTGAALLASGGARHQHHAQEGRKAIIIIGLASSLGVAIYDDNKKNRKVVLQFNDSIPKLAFLQEF